MLQSMQLSKVCWKFHDSIAAKVQLNQVSQSGEGFLRARNSFHYYCEYVRISKRLCISSNEPHVCHYNSYNLQMCYHLPKLDVNKNGQILTEFEGAWIYRHRFLWKTCRWMTLLMFYELFEAAIRAPVQTFVFRRQLPPWLDAAVRQALDEKEMVFNRAKRNSTRT